MPTWNHAAWLAKRYADAQTMPAPKPRAEIALPGAKRAIQHDRLLAHHGLDRGEHEIVALENERWERENADRLAAHAAWVSGPYHAAIAQARELEAQRAAEELRKCALFEQILAEREEG